MFSDEKGYLVTEMVWEDCSDGELVPNEPPTKHEDTRSKGPVMSSTNSGSGSKSTAAPAKSSSKSSAAAKEPGNQKSMMSFFGKK